MTSARTPPVFTLPHPIKRQCLSIRLLNAIFSPFSLHAGVVNVIVTSPPLSPAIRPPVCEAPMLTNSVSPTVSFVTFAFLLSSVLTPKSRRRRKTTEDVSDAFHFRVQERDRRTYPQL